MPPGRTPALMDELIEEILLSFSPEEPAGLVRVSLVCKPWRRLLSSIAFRRRYRKLHQTPPKLLGFLYNCDGHRQVAQATAARFVPTTHFPPRNPEIQDFYVLDCRHALVVLLLQYPYPGSGETVEPSLVVWDPMTGSRRPLPEPHVPYGPFSAAVLCAEDGCDHGACHGDPFLVLLVGTDHRLAETRAYLYSSETGQWSVRASIQPGTQIMGPMPSVLVGDALHFMLPLRGGILKATEDGVLGLALLDRFRLKLWSWKAGHDGVMGWARREVIDLDPLIPCQHLVIFPKVIGFVEGTDTMIARRHLGTYMVELKSQRSRKL